eukprot:3429170-Amphidinium_carterae.2
MPELPIFPADRCEHNASRTQLLQPRAARDRKGHGLHLLGRLFVGTSVMMASAQLHQGKCSVVQRDDWRCSQGYATANFRMR